MWVGILGGVACFHPSLSLGTMLASHLRCGGNPADLIDFSKPMQSTQEEMAVAEALFDPNTPVTTIGELLTWLESQHPIPLPAQIVWSLHAIIQRNYVTSWWLCCRVVALMSREQVIDCGLRNPLQGRNLYVAGALSTLKSRLAHPDASAMSQSECFDDLLFSPALRDFCAAAVRLQHAQLKERLDIILPPHSVEKLLNSEEEFNAAGNAESLSEGRSIVTPPVGTLVDALLTCSSGCQLSLLCGLKVAHQTVSSSASASVSASASDSASTAAMSFLRQVLEAPTVWWLARGIPLHSLPLTPASLLTLLSLWEMLP